MAEDLVPASFRVCAVSRRPNEGILRGGCGFSPTTRRVAPDDALFLRLNSPQP